MKKETFERLIRSLEQAAEIRAGKLKPGKVTRVAWNRPMRAESFTPGRIRAIRDKVKLSQAEFAELLNISKATLQNWEQGRTEPEGPAKTLLRIAERQPRALLELLHAS